MICLLLFRSYLADELIETLYNTLQSNAELAAKTLLIITFDEHGGFYDHVNPPRLLGARSEELSRLGVRVPAIFVSPSVPSNSVLRRDGLHASGGKLFPSNQDRGKVCLFVCLCWFWALLVLPRSLDTPLSPPHFMSGLGRSF